MYCTFSYSLQGKEAVEALSLREHLLSTLTERHFASFQNIRFLEMAVANVEGNFENLLIKLIWFSWHLCPSSFNIGSFYLENLVILDLSHSFIDETWGGWRWIKVLNHFLNYFVMFIINRFLYLL